MILMSDLIPSEIRLLVCGGREWGAWTSDPNLSAQRDEEYFLLFAEIESIKPDVIIHGNARGADTVADDYGRDKDIPILRYKADWTKYGKSAGVRRNETMLREANPTIVLAAPGGRGTADMVRRAKEAGIPVMYLKLSEDMK